MKTLFVFIFVCWISTECSARDFDNLILVNHPNPSVTKANNRYYLLTSEVTAKKRIPIYTSPDLQSWKFEKFAFDSDNLPAWISNETNNFWSPELHYIGGSFNLYYYAWSKAGVYSIGVATASSPAGTYKDLGKPLLEIPGESLHNPNIAHGTH